MITETLSKDIDMRYSLKEDESIIRDLLKDELCDVDEAVSDLIARYLLVFYNGNLIALSGIHTDSVKYPGWEIDITYVDKEYRRRGIATALIGYLLKYVVDEVYCDFLNHGFKHTDNMYMEQVLRKNGLVHPYHGFKGTLKRLNNRNPYSKEDYMYRWSSNSDARDISQLLVHCFGDTVKNAPIPTRGDYLVCTYKGDIVGISGIYWDHDYDSLAVQWTAVHPDFRGKGIATNLISKLMEYMPKNSVMCSAWRIGNNSYANLHRPLVTNGFRLIEKYSDNMPCIGKYGTCPYRDKCNSTCSLDFYKYV